MIATLVGALAAAALGAADPQCAKADIVNYKPAEMLDKEDDFRASLPPVDRVRLDAVLPRTADGRIAKCAGRDGTGCDAHAYLVAFRSTGLMPAFLQTLCPSRPD